MLERWIKNQGGLADPELLIAMAHALLADPAIPALTRQLWSPKLLAAMAWVSSEVAKNRADGRIPIIIEEKKTISTGEIELTGKPDRIDRLTDGRVVIVDYKSGSTQPNSKARMGGYALQLGLLGHMAQQGAFDGVALEPSGMEYWMLGKKGKQLGLYGGIDVPQGKKNNPQLAALKPETFPDFAAQRLAQVAQRWLLGNAAFTAKIRPQFSVNSDYDHLMRYLEWYGRTAPDDERVGQ
jgi:ATP-dependent helicase/nuclease subunit B